jgi:RNA polymerase sigma factor (sigma-70 family)
MMSSHVVFTGVDDATRARLEASWAEKLPRLQKSLSRYRPDLQEIRLTVHRHQQSPLRSWYEARAVIHLPTGTLAAEAIDKDGRAALDGVADEIVKEVKRHNELVRKDYVYKRKARRGADLEAAAPLLHKDVEAGRKEDFFRLLRPMLRTLRDHAERELRSLELRKLLHRGELTADDLLDEVVAQAWERFKERPRRLSPDLWLIDLLHEVLEQRIKEEPRGHLSLQAKAKNVFPDLVPSEDEREWWEELLGYDEVLTLEDLIPDWNATPAWDQLEAEKKRDLLLSAVNELPGKQRQAFLLYALEDYNTAEIAMLQDRPESEVKRDIEAARQTLRERLLAAGYGQKAESSGQQSAVSGQRVAASK